MSRHNSNSAIWLDGTLLPPERALDLRRAQPLLTGSGLFETIGVRNGSAFVPARHFQRIAAGCLHLGIPPVPFDPATLLAGIDSLLAASGRSDARVRLTRTAAMTLMTAEELPAYRDPESLLTCPWTIHAGDPLAGVKSISRAGYALAQNWARSRGAGEALFLNSSGHLCEGSVTNLFLIRSGSVLTPSLDSGCLPGVMRSVVLDLCREAGIGCTEMRLLPSDLPDCEAAFVTSALRGVHAVNRIDEQAFSVTHPLLARLGEMLNDRIANPGMDHDRTPPG